MFHQRYIQQQLDFLYLINMAAKEYCFTRSGMKFLFKADEPQSNQFQCNSVPNKEESYKEKEIYFDYRKQEKLLSLAV